MKDIKNLLSTLTDEEKELHKDLISECQAREQNYKEVKDIVDDYLTKVYLLSIPDECFFKE